MCMWLPNDDEIWEFERRWGWRLLMWGRVWSWFLVCFMLGLKFWNAVAVVWSFVYEFIFIFMSGSIQSETIERNTCLGHSHDPLIRGTNHAWYGRQSTSPLASFFPSTSSILLRLTSNQLINNSTRLIVVFFFFIRFQPSGSQSIARPKNHHHCAVDWEVPPFIPPSETPKCNVEMQWSCKSRYQVPGYDMADMLRFSESWGDFGEGRDNMLISWPGTVQRDQVPRKRLPNWSCERGLGKFLSVSSGIPLIFTQFWFWFFDNLVQKAKAMLRIGRWAGFPPRTWWNPWEHEDKLCRNNKSNYLVTSLPIGAGLNWIAKKVPTLYALDHLFFAFSSSCQRVSNLTHGNWLSRIWLRNWIN